MDTIERGPGHRGHPKHDPAAAAKLLAELRGADSLAALNDLAAWLRELTAVPAPDAAAHGEIVALIQEAGAPHVSALLAPFLLRPADRPKGHESTWPPVNSYLAEASRALGTAAERLLERAASDPSAQPAAAAAAARALHACRLFTKACLVRYLGVPPQVWRTAYTVHRHAEAAHCAAIAVRMHGGDKTTTTVEQELLRLLMLQSAAPEMMAPGQVEVADWATEQLGADFTLRPPGVADNPFCFDPAGDAPPHRAADPAPGSDAALRYFGPGMAYESLGRVFKQMGTSGSVEIKAAGKAIAPHVQLSAVQHLLAFWAERSPYTAPAREPATGTLQVVRGYSQAWQQLSHGGTSTSELSLAEDGDVPLQAPETWTLHDRGGNELGVEIPRSSADSVRCGDVVAISTGAEGEWWLGLIRSMHAGAGHGTHASIYIASRHPQAMQARMVIPRGEEAGVSEQAARQFSYANVRAIIVSDGAATSQPANALLPPESWKEGRAFEVAVEGTARFLRCVRILRRGDDYVRTTFDWTQSA